MRQIQAASRLVARGLATSVRRQATDLKQPLTAQKGIHPQDAGYRTVMNYQKQWHENPDLMVWQKRGARDSMPYTISMALCVVATVAVFANIWIMSFPKKTE